MELTFNLYDCVTKKDEDLFEFVIVNEDAQATFENYITEYFENNYNLDIEYDIYYDRKKKAPFITFYLYNNKDKLSYVINDIIEFLNYWFKLGENVYNIISDFNENYNKIQYADITPWYVEFYNKDKKSGEIDTWKPEENSISIKNSKLINEPIENFNMIKLHCFINVMPYNFNDIFNMYMSTGKRLPYNKERLETLAYKAFSKKIKDKIYKEINIEDTNIKEYIMYFYFRNIHRLEDNSVFSKIYLREDDDIKDTYIDFNVAITVFYKDDFNKDYLYLDKIVDNFIELTREMYYY